jgi:hypothetical protein
VLGRLGYRRLGAPGGRVDVDGFHGFLREIGAAILDAPAEYDYTPGYNAVFFADPDGLELEVVHEPEQRGRIE